MIDYAIYGIQDIYFCEDKNRACGRNPDCRWFLAFLFAWILTKLLTERFLDIINLMDKMNVHTIKRVRYLKENQR